MKMRFWFLVNDYQNPIHRITPVKLEAQSVATESITLLHFEIETLLWLKPEGTENAEVLELYVIPNVCSEYSEQN